MFGVINDDEYIFSHSRQNESNNSFASSNSVFVIDGLQSKRKASTNFIQWVKCFSGSTLKSNKGEYTRHQLFPIRCFHERKLGTYFVNHCFVAGRWKYCLGELFHLVQLCSCYQSRVYPMICHTFCRSEKEIVRWIDHCAAYIVKILQPMKFCPTCTSQFLVPFLFGLASTVLHGAYSVPMWQASTCYNWNLGSRVGCRQQRSGMIDHTYGKLLYCCEK